MARRAPAAERVASAEYHAGLITGALTMHGAQLEAPLGAGEVDRVVLLGETRTGLPIEITIEVHGTVTPAEQMRSWRQDDADRAVPMPE